MGTLDEFIKELKDKEINVCRISSAVRNTYFECGDKHKLPAQNFFILLTAKIGDKDIMKFRHNVGTIMAYEREKLHDKKKETLSLEKKLVKQITKEKIAVKQGRWVNE